MSKNRKHSNQYIIHLSMLCAMLFMLVPWPDTVVKYQPHWVALLVAYWSFNAGNNRVMLIAFCYGILLDILMGSLLGKHGMSLVALSFLVTKSAKQLRMTSMGQLLVMVLVLLLNDIIIRAIIDWVSFGYKPSLIDLAPLVTAGITWPWIKYFLDRIQVSYRNST